MRELLMSKVITDFKLKFQLMSGATSSVNARELTHDLLPFLMELHSCLPDRLTRALNQVISKVTGQLATTPKVIHTAAENDQESVRQHGGFIVMDREPK